MILIYSIILYCIYNIIQYIICIISYNERWKMVLYYYVLYYIVYYYHINFHASEILHISTLFRKLFAKVINAGFQIFVKFVTMLLHFFWGQEGCNVRWLPVSSWALPEDWGNDISSLILGKMSMLISAYRTLRRWSIRSQCQQCCLCIVKYFKYLLPVVHTQTGSSFHLLFMQGETDDCMAEAVAIFLL